MQSINSKQLGPYSGGSYTSRDETVKLEHISLKDLQAGMNAEKVVLGKVVCSIQDTDAVPL